MLNLLRLKNFKLFKNEEIPLHKLNIIKGINHDDEELSSNGSGKSSILEGIIFALFGEGSGKNLQDLISFDSKSTDVYLQSDDLDIRRKVPTELTIIRQGVEVQKNTNTLKQEEINSLIGDYSFFKKYRLINKQAVNLLDLGLVSLRKELMEFINADFSNIRQSLLAQKLEKEKYSISKKPYHFYLSTKRKEILEKELIKKQNDIKQLQITIDKQYEIYNNILSDIQAKIKSTDNIDNDSIQNKIAGIKTDIVCYKEKIVKLGEIKEVSYIGYTKLINSLQEMNETLGIDIEYLENEINNHQSEKNRINTEVNIEKTKSQEMGTRIIKLKGEIQNIQSLNSNSKCDKCGSTIEESKKEIFITEKQEEIKQIINDQNTINLGINHCEINGKLEEKELIKLNTELKGLKKELQINQSKIKELNEKNIEQSELKEKTSLKDADIKKYNELIEMSQVQIKELTNSIEKNKKTIEQLYHDVEHLKKQFIMEKDKLDSLKIQKETLELKEKRTNNYLMKLTEAFKFSEYKYTVKDITLYDSSIKVIDDFAGWYIQKWLDNLAIVINNLLEKINLSVTFSADKQFLTIVNEGKSMKYESLSSGQQCFLNCIFKIAILLNNGINNGVLMFDEGINTLDKINLKKLIEVLKNLQFQTFLIYQNYDLEEEVNVITVVREKGESKIG
jgi:exonuclease SbcC